MDLQEIKERKKQLRGEQLRRRKYEKYRYYEPIGKVEEFLNKIGGGEYFVSLLSAANGIGKTTALVNMLSHLFWPCGNEYFQQPIFQNWPFPLKSGRIVSDPTTVKETLVPMLEEWFPPGRYTNKNQGKSYPYSWKTDTDWDFDVMTYDQSVKEFESANLAIAWFDEPPPVAIFKATVARMRRGGMIVIFATPLSGSAWMYDEIITNDNLDGQYRTFVEAEVEDACIDHGVRGFLKHDDILKMIAQYDEEDMQARVFGKFQHLVGLVFKKFSRDIHVIDPFELDPNEYAVAHYYDTHPRVNEAILWYAVDRRGHGFIVDELWIGDEVSTDELVAQIKQKDEKYHVKKRILEPAAFTVDKRERTSYANKLNQKYGMGYVPGSKRREDARKLIRDSLNYSISGGEFIRSPTDFVFSHCTRTIWEVKHWQWDDWSGKTAERRGLKPKPQDKDDHMIENWGRAKLDPPVFDDSDSVDMSAVQRMQQQAVNDDPYS